MKDKGVSGQIKTATTYSYNKLTLKILEDFIDEISGKEEKRKNLPPYGHIGSGLYHIGDGCYCNRKGFIEFEKEFMKSLKLVGTTSNLFVNLPKIGLFSTNKEDIKKIKNGIKKC